MIIYKISNSLNDKLYVGKELKNNPNYFGSGVLIKRAIKKYGKQNFKKEIIETCYSIIELNNKEIYWIEKLKSIAPYGYNLTLGGTGGNTLYYKSKIEKIEINEKKLKTRESKKLLDPNFYKREFTEIQKEKMSAAKKGITYPNRKSAVFTEEHKKI